ncbi:unnamed protein product [Chondrus crispus]|uniref:Uncharacterized protein n=1 Tax=Chondrus crispus TaxID=2769 RepID=R7QP27_CHOCR|nr:unnamed protein product [Chondrus crispus]CDF39849.1 unnamed protein product [Chondrus crispus]|eukprot:XP_005710143.1 unnamed protein product [Chondrus crispus]
MTASSPFSALVVGPAREETPNSL